MTTTCFANAASLLICGLLAGVVVAAAAFPAVAMSGLAAKAGADDVRRPAQRADVRPPPQISYVYASDGKTLLATFYDENRRDVPLDRHLARSCRRRSSPPRTPLLQAPRRRPQGRRPRVRGQPAAAATTAGRLDADHAVRPAWPSPTRRRTPQEVVAATEETTGAQAPRDEVALAAGEEAHQGADPRALPEHRRLRHGAYGIYAASQVYFGKTPKDLTLAEAALLAGLVKAPTHVRPGHRRRATRRRSTGATTSSTKMVEHRHITQAAGRRRQGDQAQGHRQARPRTAASPPTENDWGFFCDYFYRWWIEQPAFGADHVRPGAAGSRAAATRIVTSLDSRPRRAADAERSRKKIGVTSKPTR